MKRRTTQLIAVVLLLNSLVFAQTRDTYRPTVRGTRAVVAGGHPLVAEAGMRMLHRGGNAVDAGVAATFAASVIEFSHFAFGGEVPVIIKLAGKPVVTINGQGQAPVLATREFFEKQFAGATEVRAARAGQDSRHRAARGHRAGRAGRDDRGAGRIRHAKACRCAATRN
ncbi:MAG: gamma-glutamyltransferase [Blastocatellia bacterium]